MSLAFEEMRWNGREACVYRRVRVEMGVVVKYCQSMLWGRFCIQGGFHRDSIPERLYSINLFA